MLTKSITCESDLPLTPLEKRYWKGVENHARITLGNVAFEVTFVEGQKISLDEGLDLALKTVEEM